jgi:hypothetical protein
MCAIHCALELDAGEVTLVSLPLHPHSSALTGGLLVMVPRERFVPVGAGVVAWGGEDAWVAPVQFPCHLRHSRGRITHIPTGRGRPKGPHPSTTPLPPLRDDVR